MGIYLLLGTNLGYKELNLQEAKKRIGTSNQIRRSSAVYLTQAWGNSKQSDFLNQVIKIDSGDAPLALLKKVLQIENEMGRDRMEKWGPRVIDIDILFFNDTIIHTPQLIIPHPGIQHRRFTLLPLHEIAPGLVHPILNKTVEELLAACDDPLGVHKINADWL